VTWRNLKYSTDWHLLTRQNSYNASKQKRHNAKDTNQFILGLDHGAEFLKFVEPIGPKGQKIMRSANNVSNAGPHVRQTSLNDVFTFLTEVGNTGRIVNTRTSSVNSEFVTALNT
jgi:ABC-type enterochelin transport system substrate-binding protein